MVAAYGVDANPLVVDRLHRAPPRQQLALQVAFSGVARHQIAGEDDELGLLTDNLGGDFRQDGCVHTVVAAATVTCDDEFPGISRRRRNR